MQNKIRLTELDALRGIAALMVTIYHFLLGRVSHDTIMRFGTTGVDLFFIISGFVIFMTIERCKTAKEFVISRFSRLYPAYWVCVTITFVFILFALKLGFHQDQKENLSTVYAVNLTMLQHYFNIRDLDGQYWTLIVELIFYVFILLLFTGKLLKYIKPIGTSVLLLLLVWRFFYDRVSNENFHQQLLYFVPLLKYFPLFFAGILFYDLGKKGISIANIFLIILCFATQVYMYDKFHRHIWILSTADFSMILGVYFILFFLFIFKKLSWIANKYTVILGEISYSLYLIHNFTGAKMIIPVCMKKLGLSLWPSVMIALVSVIFIAFTINRLIEKPAMLAIRNRFLERK